MSVPRSMIDLSFCGLVYYNVWLITTLILSGSAVLWQAHASDQMYRLSSASPVWNEDVLGFVVGALELVVAAIFPALLHMITLSVCSTPQNYYRAGRIAIIVTLSGSLLALFLLAFLTYGGFILLILSPVYLIPCVLAGWLTNRLWAKTL